MPRGGRQRLPDPDPCGLTSGRLDRIDYCLDYCLDYFILGGECVKLTQFRGDVRAFLSRHGMAWSLLFCLTALAINAVLIHTVMPDESLLKNGVRAVVLIVAAIALVLARRRIPIAVYLMVFLSVILLAVRQNLDQLSFIFVLVLVMALLSVQAKQLDRLVLISSFVPLALVFIFLTLGITENSVIEFRNRMTFGTNGVPFFYNLVYGAFSICVFYLFKYKVSHRRLTLLLCIAATTVLYVLSDARGGYLSFLAFVVLLYLVPKLSRFGVFRITTALLPLIFLLLAFYIATLGENLRANVLLSYRPNLFQRYFAEVDIFDVLFSTSVKQFPLAVDNSYIHLLFGGGIVLCCAFFILFARAIRSLFQQGRFPEIAFLIATCVYFNSESLLLRIENIFVIYFWYLVLRHSLSSVRRGMSRVAYSGIPTIAPKPESTGRPLTES